MDNMDTMDSKNSIDIVGTTNSIEKTNTQEKVITNSKITCPHFKIHFQNLVHSKRLNPKGYKQLQDSFGIKINVDLQEICLDCYLLHAQG